MPRRGMDAWLFAGNPRFHGVRGAWPSTARRSRSGARDHQNPICRLLVRGGGAPDCAHCLVVEIIAFPVAGTVQQLSVHTIGGVVTPAQALLVVVPGDSHLEIEAMVLNRDIGFVQAGQDAQIKIDTFNFSRYGLRWAVLPLLDGAAVKRGEIENGIVIAVHSNSFRWSLLIIGDLADNFANRQLIVDLVRAAKLPAIFPFREYFEIGALMAYGP